MNLNLDPESVKGFLDPAEGGLLYETAYAQAAFGPCVEIGGYCGKSAVYIGSACAAQNEILFSVDHHRGSEEQQPGEEFFDPDLFAPLSGQIDTFREFRKTIAAADLEGCLHGPELTG